ncbi:C40 family peptidase [Pseudomonas sp. NPDC086278]|uniref:C40 family peptidase n=1 Tax=Pseudomonas sp. NPDC086278 TaxID=3390646 RepID=UPI003D04DB90
MRVVERAKELIGTPYKRGGTSQAKGFDCSGLLVYLFRKEAGMVLPRTTSSMIKERYQRVSRNELQPGDAVFFSYSNQKQVDHVGLYIGNNRFIHAPRTGKNVRIDSMNNQFWNDRFFSARRFNSKR